MRWQGGCACARSSPCRSTCTTLHWFVRACRVGTASLEGVLSHDTARSAECWRCECHCTTIWCSDELTSSTKLDQRVHYSYIYTRMDDDSTRPSGRSLRGTVCTPGGAVEVEHFQIDFLSNGKCWDETVWQDGRIGGEEGIGVGVGQAGPKKACLGGGWSCRRSLSGENHYFFKVIFLNYFSTFRQRFCIGNIALLGRNSISISRASRYAPRIFYSTDSQILTLPPPKNWGKVNYLREGWTKRGQIFTKILESY